MPDHAGSNVPNAAVSPPELSTTDRVPEQDDVAIRRAPRKWMRLRLAEYDPGNPFRFGSSDLVEGSVAVAALVVMVVIGMTLWWAIPLAVLTYFAVSLLRPVREDQAEVVGSTAAEPPGIETISEDHAHLQSPDGALIGSDAVAARFKLTRREQEILPLLAQRLTDREIAEHLSISHRTAMNHTANILGKLGLASRRDVAVFVAQHGPLPASTSSRNSE